MAGNQPEEQVGCPMAYQGWRNISFLHWRYDPEVLQRHLPDGLEPDLVDGEAWVGLTPFAVEGFRMPGTPALPVVSQYPETNLRTYVRDGRGGEGLWFFSLEVESFLTVAAARPWLGVPYFPARMRVTSADGLWRYESRRLVGPPARHHIEVRPGPALPEGPSRRDALLLGRWRAYSRRAGIYLQVPVEHPPWPVHSATVVELQESLTAAAGLPPPDHEPVVHWSPGVDVKLGCPRVVRPRSGA